MAENIDVSIIIVNWNAKNLLKKCIDSIIMKENRMKYEIIVIDNNSNDGSRDLCEHNYANSVRLIKNRQNRGFAAANNQGIKESKGKFILLLNSDTEVLDNALDKCFEYISSHKDIGLIGCRLLNSDGTLQYSCYNFNSILRSIIFKIGAAKIIRSDKRYKYEGLITSADYDSLMDVDYVCGAFMMFRREIIDKIGLLDERFFMYAEEADYCARIKNAGYRIAYFPEASVIHHGGGSSKSISVLSENRRIISRLLFIKKHKGNLYFNVYRFFSILVAAANIISGDEDRRSRGRSKLKAILKLKYE